MATRKRQPPKKRSAARKRTPAPEAEQQSPNAAYELTDADVEQALQTGAYAGLLEDYFGPENYKELRQLKRDAAARGMRGGPKVLILPGIMGSKIGRDRALIDDVTWIDPIGIALGHLTQIALPDGGKHKALGVILLAYLKLKLRLEREGYDADFYPFDWRQSVDVLGKELKQKLDKLGENTSLVAHSMGGLVSRSAIAQGAKFKKLIMLGTPNFGSFAPVMALRATYPVVRKVAWLDTKHTPEQLARDVFSTFPGLTQMLPFKSTYEGSVNVYDAAAWPEADKGCAPRAEILRDAPDVQDGLAPGSDQMFMIAGVDQSTVIGVRAPTDGSKDLTYEVSREGDGTVPLQYARLPGVKATYYIPESHGSLPNNAVVARAVIDLLERDRTTALPDLYDKPVDRRPVELVHESKLRVDPYEGTRGRSLSQSEVRTLISEVVSPDAHESMAKPMVTTGATVFPVAGARFEHPFDRIRVGRNNYHRIDLRFAYGSITEADTRALALGLFPDVAPSGAARAIDLRMDGAITDIFRRRMFSAQVGEVFMLPTGRHQIIADFLAFVGMGPFDRFSDEVLQTAAENTIRTLISARIEEFATVLFGGGSGESPESALRGLLTGFLKGLSDADKDHHFRRIVICEQNRDRYLAIKEELYRLSSTSLCDSVELTFDEVVLRPPPELASLPTRVLLREDPAYLIVRQERTGAKDIEIRSSVLTVGSKATVITGARTVDVAEFEQMRRKIVNQPKADFTAAGREMAALVLAEPVLAVLPNMRQHPLVVVHDAPMSRIPWETLAFGDKDATWFPAADRGLTHRYAADNLSVAKWLEQRIEDNILSVLLVVNPTEDLDGAEKEGERVRALLGKHPGCKFKELRNGAASRPALLAAFNSGEFDIIHYAGHAEFDEGAPERSGIVCANEIRLTGADLAGLARLPTLVFFNACEAARVRGRRAGKKTAKKTSAATTQKEREDHLREGVGLAEAFMRGGVANFVGTYWPVGDDAASTFAESFYTDLVDGKSLGEAIRNGRALVRKSGSPDWANYTFYGNADFVLKENAQRSGEG